MELMKGSGTNIVVREAAREDVARMAELTRATPTGAQWSSQQFAKILEGGDSTRIVLVAETPEQAEDGGVQGFIVASVIGNECEIENVVVNPPKQQRGLGETLLREVLKRIQSRDCAAVFLEVRESNRGARRLYEKCGFREAGRRMKYYVQPVEDAVIYRIGVDVDAAKTVQG